MFRMYIDDRDFKRAMADMARDMPKAFAISLTWTAKDAQADLQARLAQSFILRRPWIKNRIRITPARAPAQLFSEVGSIDPFMGIHEKGGEKKAQKHSLAVPMVGTARKTKQSITPRSKWPGKLLEKPKYFILRTKRGARLVAKRRTKNRYPVQLFYALAKEVRIPPRWNFSDQVFNSVRKHWGKNAIRAVDRIMTKSKGR